MLETLLSATGMRPDPEFALGGFRDLRMPHDWRNATAADYYAHRVSRSPRDLLAHAQRIRLMADMGDEAGTCGALADLFIALGPAGRPLRARLLGECAGVLGSECREAFARGLDAGPPGGAACHRHGTSVLDEAIEGRLDLVAVATGGGAGIDRIAVAEGELELGNLAGARDLLEELLDEPGSRERALDLLATIYRKTSDGQRFRAVDARFPDAGARIDSWREARSHLARA